MISVEDVIKMARFDINLDRIGIESYIERNNFNRLKQADSFSLGDFYDTSIPLGDVATRSDLYFTKGSCEDESWQMLLDRTSGRLWVTIKY